MKKLVVVGLVSFFSSFAVSTAIGCHDTSAPVASETISYRYLVTCYYGDGRTRAYYTDDYTGLNRGMVILKNAKKWYAGKYVGDVINEVYLQGPVIEVVVLK